MTIIQDLKEEKALCSSCNNTISIKEGFLLVFDNNNILSIYCAVCKAIMQKPNYHLQEEIKRQSNHPFTDPMLMLC